MREFMNKHTFLFMATELATDHDMETVTVAVVSLTFSMFVFQTNNLIQKLESFFSEHGEHY